METGGTNTAAHGGAPAAPEKSWKQYFLVVAEGGMKMSILVCVAFVILAIAIVSGFSPGGSGISVETFLALLALTGLLMFSLCVPIARKALNHIPGERRTRWILFGLTYFAIFGAAVLVAISAVLMFVGLQFVVGIVR